MRPRLENSEKRREKFIIRVSKEEKLRIKAFTKAGKYACMSDFVRNRILAHNKKKKVNIDDETNEHLKRLDFELNKIGVNLNQLSKRVNSFAGYNIGDNDRQLLRQAFESMNRCLAFLQKHLR